MSVVTSKIRWALKGEDGASATLQTLASRILVLALNVGTGILTARSLGPDGRGELAAVMLWPSFLPYLMTLGLPLALLYTIKKNPEEEPKLYGAALVLGGSLGCLAACVGILIMPMLLKQYSTEVIHFAQWLMLSAPIGLLGLVFLIPLQARGEFHRMNQLSYLPPVLTLISLCGLALAHSMTLLAAGLAYVVPKLLVFFWLLRYMLKRFPPQWYMLRQSYKRLMSYGIRVYGIDLLSTVSGQVSQLLVVGLLKPIEMGLYVIAMALSRMLNLLQNSVTTILISKATARAPKEVVAMTGQSARASTALTAVGAIFVILFGQFFLQLLYGPEFVEAVSVLRLLAIEAVLGGTILILVQAFTALGKPEIVTISQMVGLAISIPMMIWLIPLYGLSGAGIALLISTIVRMVFVLISYPFVLKINPPSLIPTRKDFEAFKGRGDNG